ncbi:unnamed protein product, partial [Vitis vinifera]
MSPHLSSSSSISLSSSDAQNENLIFPSKTLKNFLSIISFPVSFKLLGKIVIPFFFKLSQIVSLSTKETMSSLKSDKRKRLKKVAKKK